MTIHYKLFIILHVHCNLADQSDLWSKLLLYIKSELKSLTFFKKADPK